MDRKKVFRNDRLTFRLHVLAQTAIDRNDAIFLSETGCSIRELRVLRLVADNPGITFVEITRLTKRLEAVANQAASSLDSSDYLFEDDDTIKTKRVYESYGHKE